MDDTANYNRPRWFQISLGPLLLAVVIAALAAWGMREYRERKRLDAPATKQIPEARDMNDMHAAPVALDPLAKAVIQYPNDVGLIERLRSLAGQMFAKQIHMGIAPAQEFVSRLKGHVLMIAPGTDEASLLVDDLRETVDFYQRYLDAHTTSTEEIEARLIADPNDVDAILLYEVKVQVDNDRYYEKDADLAHALLAHSESFLAELRDRSIDDKVRETAAGLSKELIPARKHKIVEASTWQQIIGQEAVYPDATSLWLNGHPMTIQDLNGKVVLFAFWEMWSDASVDAISALGKLHENYSQDGLVVIGVTDYCGFTWDEHSGRAVPSSQIVDNADEREAIEHCLTSCKCPFPSVIDSEDKLSLAYRVDGVPSAILVNRLGKVCLARSGMSAEMVDDIESQVVVLLKDKEQPEP